jgi:pimeloyl-ACP methyl ester carboxylesterase
MVLTVSIFYMNDGMVSLNYEVYGDKKEGVAPLVVLHGWANSLEVIKPLAVKLAEYSQVYSLDLPGHGKSPVPDEVWGMKEFAEVLKQFLDEHGLSSVVLVGHSFGGKTGIMFTSLYPEYVRKIVLIGASGIRPEPDFRKRLRNLFLQYLRNFIRFKQTSLGKRIYEKWYIPRFASRDYLAAGPLTKTFVKTVNEELHNELLRIKIPALLLWGDDDDESPPSVGKKMNDLIEGSQLIVLPRQGHYPFLGGTAPLVIKYIRDFLAH